jgi:flagellar hook assembly protein FlgD
VDPSSVRIKQDGIEMPASAFSVDRSPADPRSVPVLFPASLGEGHHSLEFEAADLLGNRSAIRDEVDVLVSFGLYEIANYPNPVDGDLTTFYFLVGDHADRWRTDIYTIAGRHLRTLEGGYASGVHTFDWDLTDGDGRMVANGVYLYVMTVWSGERAEKRTGKMAVLR